MASPQRVVDMTTVPYQWTSFCAEQPASGRWDQQWVDRILGAVEWRVPGGYRFAQGDITDGGIIIFPAGHYDEHCGAEKARRKLQKLVTSMPWSVVIATSDEGSTFPWWGWQGFANHRLWVMTPRVDVTYPPNTFFIGEGSPSYPIEVVDKTIDVFFAGQINHERRDQMQDAVEKLRALDYLTIETEYTQAFATGLPVPEYLDRMARARIVPCPSGPVTQDSFRFFEALEAGAIPIADALRPDGHGDGYWDLLFPTKMWPEMRDWNKIVPLNMFRYAEQASNVSSWWQQEKRRVAYRLQNDVHATSRGRITPVVETAADLITVLMVTSPSPLHPSTTIIEQTLDSVRTRLPGAEILIGVDGIRPEDRHREGEYHEYKRRLGALSNPLQNVCPIVFHEHRHQSGMARFLLEQTHTPYVLWMEGDTPLTGEIPFDDCLGMMKEHELAILRFTHEAGILDEHQYLFLDRKPGVNPFVRTVQYSARPHLILADKFRDLLATYFGRSRTFLEDTLYGALQYTGTAATGRRHTQEAWERHRMAVYAPKGSWKRSEHLDGRGGDPKYPGWIEYDHDRPEGGPPEGWMPL